MDDRTIIETLYHMDRAHFDTVCDGLDPDYMRDLGGQAMHLAINYTQVAEYLSQRGQGKTHRQALRLAEERTHRVRQAIGYVIEKPHGTSPPAHGAAV